MRQSIGTTFMLNFIILFIFLVFAFLAGTLSYYKSYRINNYIVNAIEKFEGYNHYSEAEISRGLSSMGYDASLRYIECPPDREITHISYQAGAVNSYSVLGELVNSNEFGYCIYLYMNDNAALAKNGSLATTDVYYTYGILTYMQLRFPGFENSLKIPIFSRSNRMYYFG